MACPDYHIINNLILAQASSSRTGEYWAFSYGPRCTRSILPLPRANIPLHSVVKRLVLS